MTTLTQLHFLLSHQLKSTINQQSAIKHFQLKYASPFLQNLPRHTPLLTSPSQNPNPPTQKCNSQPSSPASPPPWSPAPTPSSSPTATRAPSPTSATTTARSGPARTSPSSPMLGAACSCSPTAVARERRMSLRCRTSACARLLLLFLLAASLRLLEGEGWMSPWAS